MPLLLAQLPVLVLVRLIEVPLDLGPSRGSQLFSMIELDTTFV